MFVFSSFYFFLFKCILCFYFLFRLVIVNADGQISLQLIPLKPPDRMVLHGKVEVKITTATRSWLQIALVLQAKPRAVPNACWDPNLHPFVVDRKGSFSAAKGISETHAHAGFSVEIDWWTP